LLALSAGVFGTLVMHSPKVPHPDFSVQVVRHNLKIFAVENFDRGKAPGSERRIGVRRSAPVLSALCVTGIGLANTNERWEQVADTVVPRMKHLQSDT